MKLVTVWLLAILCTGLLAVGCGDDDDGGGGTCDEQKEIQVREDCCDEWGIGWDPDDAVCGFMHVGGDTDDEGDGYSEYCDCKEQAGCESCGNETEYGDTDSASDSDTDSDTDTDTGDPAEPISQDCSECDGVGNQMVDILCALDICDHDLIESAEYVSPTGSPTAATYAGVSHFGSTSNDLSPVLNDSYALMATGPAQGTEHSVDVGGSSGPDPYAAEHLASAPIYNEMEWQLTLEAPDEAHGFMFKYVFFSEEYDERVGGSFGDKFYVFLEAASTNAGVKTVINFTGCRDPDLYYDFECPDGMLGCETGEKYCYISPNSRFSDCCWYQNCPDGYSWDVGTDITGTGFECAADQTSDDSTSGSSTGWLATTWPINPGEVFNITFHIHDTMDGVLDSEVILDGFQFTYNSLVPETNEL